MSRLTITSWRKNYTMMFYVSWKITFSDALKSLFFIPYQFVPQFPALQPCNNVPHFHVSHFQSPPVKLAMVPAWTTCQQQQLQQLVWFDGHVSQPRHGGCPHRCSQCRWSYSGGGVWGAVLQRLRSLDGRNYWLLATNATSPPSVAPPRSTTHDRTLSVWSRLSTAGLYVAFLNIWYMNTGT